MEPEELQPQSPAQPPSSNGQPWLASQLLQRQVVNATTLEPIGRVADVAFNPESCRVTALILEWTPTEGELTAAVRRAFRQRRTIASVGLDHVIALSGDVVTIDSDPVRSAVVPSSGPGRVACLCDICDLTIITFRGICLGSLADVLLDGSGRVVTGYVVKPTKQALSLLPPFMELAGSSPLHLETAGEAEAEEEADSGTDATPLAEPPAADLDLRLIPASPRVRIGDALILVSDEVEPRQQEAVVVITGQAEEQPAEEHSAGERTRRDVRHNSNHWRWMGQSESH